MSLGIGIPAVRTEFPSAFCVYNQQKKSLTTDQISSPLLRITGQIRDRKCPQHALDSKPFIRRFQNPNRANG
jgi:hypothetical protein